MNKNRNSKECLRSTILGIDKENSNYIFFSKTQIEKIKEISKELSEEFGKDCYLLMAVSGTKENSVFTLHGSLCGDIEAAFSEFIWKLDKTDAERFQFYLNGEAIPLKELRVTWNLFN